MVETKYEKKALIDGIGNLYLQFMETEDTGVKAPTYAVDVYETPSIDQVEATIEASGKDIHLSNILHDQFENITAVSINLQAGYLPTGFAEKAQGMVDEGDGAWSMPPNPKKVPFKMSFPVTDMNDDEIIYIFPKCTLSPTPISGKTRAGEKQEQIPTFEIKSIPLVYKKNAEDKTSVYRRVDLTTEEAKKAWDRIKLLTTAIYDKETLDTAKKSV